MKRICSHVAAVVVSGIAASTMVPACAENDQSLFIRGALAPASTRTAGACVYTSDPSQAFLFSPLVDIGLTDTYEAVLLVGNQLVGRGDSANNRLESNRVHVNGGVVNISKAGGPGPEFFQSFTSFASSFIDPQNNNTPGFGPVGLTIFDAGTKAAVEAALTNRQARVTLLVSVKVFGVTTGDKEVESGEIQLPMQVCKGCLVSFIGASDPDPTKPQPNCLKPLAAATDANNGPCSLGQDLPIPCQVCPPALGAACNPATP